MILAPVEHEPKQLLGGLVYAEGIRWHDNAGWFSDITGHRIVRCWLDGRSETVVDLRPAGREAPRLGPSGLGFLPDGTLLAAMMSESGPRRGHVLAVRDGEVRLHADLSELVPGRLNDMVVAPDGTAYVGALDDGSVVQVDPDGASRVVLRGVRLPNGMAITDDGAALLLVEGGAQVRVCAIAPDGALGPSQPWADLTLEAAIRRHLVAGATGPITWEDLVAVGGADGVVLDADGGLWVGTAGGEKFLRLIEGGYVTDVVRTPGRYAVACALGGEDGRILLMTTASLTPGSIRTGGIGSPALVAQFLAAQTTSAIEVSDLRAGGGPG